MTLRSRLCRGALVGALLLPVALEAQRTDQLGVRVRVLDARSQQTLTIGSLVQLSADSVVIRTLTANEARVRLDESVRLEISQGMKGQVWRGMKWGWWIGFGAGVLYMVAAIADQGLQGAASGEAAVWTMAIGTLGGMYGTMIGAVVGALNRTERWQPMLPSSGTSAGR